MKWEQSEDLKSKSIMVSKLVSFYSKKNKSYLYNDFYKLTNWTLELLLKEKELKEK